MNAIDSLLTLARLYAQAEAIELKTVSWRALGDSKKLSALEAGGDIQVKRSDAARQWFSDHWPPALAWPAAIERPARTAESSA